ncbi:MAG: hypothetical protein JSR99_09915 [Proteobacteria bacterium]|nr:hypothetical protein [Pseudomonadota bacterium]
MDRRFPIDIDPDVVTERPSDRSDKAGYCGDDPGEEELMKLPEIVARMSRSTGAVK